jgi:ABC-type transport system involved in cytochrome c biogenesis permease subunit
VDYSCSGKVKRTQKQNNMAWINFPLYAIVSGILWILGATVSWTRIKRSNTIAIILSAIGTIIFGVFITKLWLMLERPPMRTLGETRLWYSLFLAAIGIVTFIRWRYKWFLTYSLLMAILFIVINVLNPETYNKTLMPALQSVWFVPHVIVYIFSYALLAASSLVAVFGLYNIYIKKKNDVVGLKDLADNIVYIGFAFLTFGLLFGALWAKEAWGHYWTWDPKETWAFITWMGYLVYIHLSYKHTKSYKTAFWVLSLAFVFLLICWFGINYMPSAANSVHTYSS